MYFLQNDNNLKFKLFFRLYTWPTKQVFCLYLRRILDNESFWMSPKSTFLAWGGRYLDDYHHHGGRVASIAHVFWGRKPMIAAIGTCRSMLHLPSRLWQAYLYRWRSSQRWKMFRMWQIYDMRYYSLDFKQWKLALLFTFYYFKLWTFPFARLSSLQVL